MTEQTTSSSTSTTTTNAIASLNAINLAAYIANVGFVNGVPALFDLPDNGEMSRKYQTIVTPAGWAFAIWGLIFLMQAIWSVVQVAIPSIRSNPLVLQGVGYDYVWVCACQVAWTFAFGFEQISLSLVFMLGILYFLLRIYRNQQTLLVGLEESESFSKNYWLLRFPFGLHLGWITAATLVNMNVVLVAYNNVISANLQFYAAMFTLAITLIVTTGVLFSQAEKPFPDVVIPLVLVWALNAISKELYEPKELIVDTFSQSQIDIVKNGASTAALVVLISTVFVVARAFWKKQGSSRPEAEPLLNE